MGGVTVKGEDVHTAVLTEDKVRQIRRLLGAGHHSQSELARVFGVSRQVVSLIATGKTWKGIE